MFTSHAGGESTKLQQGLVGAKLAYASGMSIFLTVNSVQNQP